MNEHSPVLALAVMGSSIAMVQTYGTLAPTLQELRSRDNGDITGRQQLLDADILLGTAALLAGTLASWEVRNFLPLLVLGGTFLMVSWWHHQVLAGNNEYVERYYRGGN